MQCQRCRAPVIATEVIIRGHRLRHKIGFCKACTDRYGLSELLRFAGQELKAPADSAGTVLTVQDPPQLETQDPKITVRGKSKPKPPGDLVRVARKRKRRTRASGWRNGAW